MCRPPTEVDRKESSSRMDSQKKDDKFQNPNEAQSKTTETEEEEEHNQIHNRNSRHENVSVIEDEQLLLWDKKMKMGQAKLKRGTLYACISLVLLISAFSLVMPHMQSRRDELQCDSLCQGGMTSARSALSFIGSALMGRLSDASYTTASSSSSLSNGRIVCLMIGTFATLAGFLIDASMYSIRGLWMGMVPAALLQQNFNIYKALLADYHEDISQLHSQQQQQHGDTTVTAATTSTAAARAGSVGKLGMSVGLAFMVGPLLGATLVNTYQQAVSIACFLTLLSLIWVLQMPIPTSHQKRNTSITHPSPATDKPTSSTTNNTTTTTHRKKHPIKTKPAMFLIVIRASMALAFHIFNTIWTVSLKQRFNFGPSDHGKFMSFIGLTFALSQGFIAKLILKPFETNTKNTNPSKSSSRGRVYVILVCCVALGVGRVIAFQVNDLKLVYLMFAFIVTALGVVNTILTADTCLIAPSSQIGGVYGVLEAAQSAAGMVGPFLGGLLAQKIHPIQAPLTAVVALYAFVFFLVLFGYERLILQNSPQTTTATTTIQMEHSSHVTKKTQ